MKNNESGKVRRTVDALYEGKLAIEFCGFRFYFDESSGRYQCFRDEEYFEKFKKNKFRK